MAAAAFCRRITPVHTPFDGDVVFAASTAPEASGIGPLGLLSTGSAAVYALEQAIERAVSRRVES
jgi:L-aminopeptidase/D-esterase-like protein